MDFMKKLLEAHPARLRHPRIPEPLQNDPEMWKKYLISAPAGNAWRDCPFPEVKKDLEVLRALIPRLDLYEAQKIFVHEAPKEIRHNPELWKMVLLKHPFLRNQCPLESVRNDPEVIEKATSFWRSSIRHKPKNREYFQATIREWRECGLPEVQNDPEIIEKVKQAYRGALTYTTDPVELRVIWYDCPFEDIKNDPSIRAIIQERGLSPEESPEPAPAPAPVTAHNVWSSAFNDNYIGRLS
jgi:hypothetical protein